MYVIFRCYPFVVTANVSLFIRCQSDLLKWQKLIILIYVRATEQNLSRVVHSFF